MCLLHQTRGSCSPFPPAPALPSLPLSSICQLLYEEDSWGTTSPSQHRALAFSLPWVLLLCLLLFEAKRTSIISLMGAVHGRPQSLRQLEQKGICRHVWDGRGGAEGQCSPTLPPRQRGAHTWARPWAEARGIHLPAVPTQGGTKRNAPHPQILLQKPCFGAFLLHLPHQLCGLQ